MALDRITLDDACVQITIDRAYPQIRGEKKFIFLTAADERGATLTIKLDRQAWEGIQAEWPTDPLAGVEDIARHGHWRTYQGERVWRIDFI